ncbi:MAG: hypothetical protein SCK28_05265 [Bacillota bacterium]|nr:hypothetical protein [Bacillota bacterium]
MNDVEEVIKRLVALVNRNFDMDVVLDQANAPYIQSVKVKRDSSLEDFLNELIGVIEGTNTNGALMYYFGDELDFDTPEEYHRH